MYSEEEIEQIAIYLIQSYYDYEAKYTNGYIKTNLSIPLKMIINNIKAVEDLAGITNVSSISQGGRSVSFNSSIKNMYLTEEVKAVLPPKKNFYAW
ncbi:MAG: hypothetical protein E6860_05110 [Clostridium sp.]|uniref:hypothetical protein n=1 Tax=Clostridium sp. TaxID=1506 RepID=UPI0029033027|nr:hypothetical protein [Clostridium sp.]MDU1584910.1 hypothetical protein [Clostridium sp.]MDU1978084.1 hypothetical protein [Clostridium sp.]MDU1993101.1 hypothetical protein [Clostridium sp.]MDU6048185.1 hypothetical protein [Clostridium sp.]MDU6221098.1 hypothetical protein [Clostridium sp.]